MNPGWRNKGGVTIGKTTISYARMVQIAERIEHGVSYSNELDEITDNHSNLIENIFGNKSS